MRWRALYVYIMKRIIMFLTAIAEGTGGAATAKVYTSDKLTALNAERKEKFTSVMSLEYGTKEQNDGLTEVFAIDAKIRAEIAALKTAEKEAETAELRNKEVAKLAERDAALVAMNAEFARKGATDDTKAITKEAFDKLNEPIISALLSKFGGVKPASVSANGEAKTGGAKGGTSATIRQMILDHVAAGKTPTEACKLIVEAGYSRGTTGAVRTAMKNEGLINS